jgi:hypothetical protein
MLIAKGHYVAQMDGQQLVAAKHYQAPLMTAGEIEEAHVFVGNEAMQFYFSRPDLVDEVKLAPLDPGYEVLTVYRPDRAPKRAIKALVRAGILTGATKRGGE